jgi:hypothetical protein
MHKIILATLTVFLMGFGEKHSDVEVTSKKLDKKIEVEFKVKAHNDYLITLEAPWSIELSNPKGLSFYNKKEVFKSKKMITKLPGFKEKVQLKAGAKESSFDYKIKAFVCTKDKKRCFPQSLKGSYNIK